MQVSFRYIQLHRQLLYNFADCLKSASFAGGCVTVRLLSSCSGPPVPERMTELSPAVAKSLQPPHMSNTVSAI